MHDVIIIGAGPAGLTAALYVMRAEKTALILEAGGFGGQITHSPKIENYPGFTQICGNELADKLTEQVLSHGVDFELTRALGIKRNGKYFTVNTEDGDFDGKSVIIATGAKHRTLGLEGEHDIDGVSYCAVCDGAFYKGRSVAVIGGGNSAMQEALLLCEGCTHVTMIQFLPELTGEASLAKQIAERDNIDIMYSSEVAALISENGELCGLAVRDRKSGDITDIKVEGMFVCIGLEPENDGFADMVKLSELGYVDADESCLTSQNGIFVAGDCRTKSIRQITTATADGATAALAAIRYCDSI